MSEPSIDTNKIFAFLRKLVEGKKLSVQDAHEASNEIYNMAAINTIERLYSRLDALDSKYESLRWLIGVGLSLIGFGITLIGLMVAYGTFFAG